MRLSGSPFLLLLLLLGVVLRVSAAGHDPAPAPAAPVTQDACEAAEGWEWVLVRKVPPEFGCRKGSVVVFDWAVNAAGSVHAVFSDPKSCLVCSLVHTVLSFLHPMGVAAFEVLLSPVALLLGVGLMGVLTLGALRVATLGPSASGASWRPLVGTALRFAVAVVLLGAVGGYATDEDRSRDRSGVFSEVYCRVVEPLLGVSVSMGMLALEAVTVSPRDAGSAPEASFVGAARVNARLFLDSETEVAGAAGGCPRDDGTRSVGLVQVLTLAHGLNMVVRLGIAQGVGFISDARHFAEVERGFVVVLAGVVLMAVFIMFLMVTALRLLDPLLRLLLVLSIAPLLIGAWVFATLRPMAEVGLRVLLYSLFYFLLAGVVYGVAFSVVTWSMRSAHELSPAMEAHAARVCAGWAPSYDPAVEPVQAPHDFCWCRAQYVGSYRGLIGCALRNGGALVWSADAADPSGLTSELDLRRVLIAILGLLLAQSVLGLLTPLCGALSRYQAGENLATAPESKLRGLATSGVRLGGWAAVMAPTLAHRAGSWVTGAGRKLFGGVPR